MMKNGKTSHAGGPIILEDNPEYCPVCDRALTMHDTFPHAVNGSKWRVCPSTDEGFQDHGFEWDRRDHGTHPDTIASGHIISNGLWLWPDFNSRLSVSYNQIIINGGHSTQWIIVRMSFGTAIAHHGALQQGHAAETAQTMETINGSVSIAETTKIFNKYIEKIKRTVIFE